MVESGPFCAQQQQVHSKLSHLQFTGSRLMSSVISVLHRWAPIVALLMCYYVASTVSAYYVPVGTVQFKEIVQPKDAVRPSARFDAAMVFDATQWRLMCFGGKTVDNVVSDELMIYDIRRNTWAKKQKHCEQWPSGRKDGSAAFISPNYSLALISGGQGRGGKKDVLEDAWILNTKTHDLWAAKGKSMDLLRREGHSSCTLRDPRFDHMVVFGGRDSEGNLRNDFVKVSLLSRDSIYIKALTNTTTTFTSRSDDVPEPRMYSTLVDVSAQNPGAYCSLVVFGGVGKNGPLNDLWCFGPADRRWIRIKHQGDIPSPRSGHHLMFDPKTRMLILFGGEDARGNGMNDVYVMSLHDGVWRRLKLADDMVPPGRLGAAAVSIDFDSAKKEINFYVTLGISGFNKPILYYNDVWVGTIPVKIV